MNKGGTNNSTPFRTSCDLGNLPIIRYLASQGADINKADDTNTTPLFIASYLGRLPVVEFLISQATKTTPIYLYEQSPYPHLSYLISTRS